MTITEAIEDKYSFKSHIEEFFSDKSELEFGYDDGYYWEQWFVRLSKENDILIVEFRIGSYSGWIETRNHVESLTLEDFRTLLLNKKFADEEITLIKLIEEATEYL